MPISESSHPADSHAAIRVRGARENNLRVGRRRHPEAAADGVHRGVRLRQELAGLRHHRGGVAAADQRDLQRVRPGLHAQPGPARTWTCWRASARRSSSTRSGWAPTRAPPSGTATDAHALLRIVFSRLGEPSAGPAFHYSFNTPAGACPNCEGRGSVTDIDLDELVDADKSLNGGRDHGPRLHRRTAGWCASSASPVCSTATSRSGTTPPRSGRRFLYAEPVKVKIATINMTYEGLVPRVRKSFLPRTRRACSRTCAPSSTGPSPSPTAPTAAGPG